MQITGLTTSASVYMGKTTSAPVDKPAQGDEAVINFPANSFSSLVKEASDMPEVRGEVVDSFKSRIASGAYPSQEDISGLADMIGSHVVQQARSNSSAQ